MVGTLVAIILHGKGGDGVNYNSKVLEMEILRIRGPIISWSRVELHIPDNNDVKRDMEYLNIWRKI